MSPSSGSSRRLLRRLSFAAGAALLAIPLMAVAASAHIAVATPDAVRGGEVAQLSFRVPDESAEAGTIKVRIDMPADAPVAEVKVRSIPGWTSVVTERKLASPTKIGDFTLTRVPASVTWTAESGNAIAPGEFQVFEIIIAPVPDVAVLTFAAVQTYSDGSVMTWNQPDQADGSEAEYPSPSLDLSTPVLSASPSESGTAAQSPTASPSMSVVASPVSTSTGGASEGTDSLARVMAGLALVAGVAALVLVSARARR